MKSSPHRPILDSQPGDSGEFRHVSSDQREIMHQRDCCDLQIHWPDDTTPSLQIVPNHSILIRTWIVERKRDHFAQRPRDFFFPHSDIAIFLCAMHELRTDGRANYNLVNTRSGEAINQLKILRLENLYPDIAVEQVAHYQVFAGDSGNSGGRSNSKSFQQPITSANSGIRSFISSRVGSDAFGSSSSAHDGFS